MKGFVFGFATLLVLAGGTAQAADLYAGPIWGGATTTQSVICKIANVTATDKTITARVLSSSGVELSNSGELTIAAGTSIAAIYAPNGANQYVTCHFHVKGAKGGYRAQASFVNGTAPFNYNDQFGVPAN